MALDHRLVFAFATLSQLPLRLTPASKVLLTTEENLDALAHGVAVVKADIVGEVLGVERQISLIYGSMSFTLGNFQEARIVALGNGYAVPGIERAAFAALPSTRTALPV